jgi:hypothetical protein
MIKYGAFINRVFFTIKFGVCNTMKSAYWCRFDLIVYWLCFPLYFVEQIVSGNDGNADEESRMEEH